VPDDRPRVIVLYSHPLLGEGLARLIGEEQGIDVLAVDVADVAAVEAAIAGSPEVIVVEEGGRLDGIDVLREAGAPVVVDVDIRSADAWALHRDPLASRPEAVLGAIRDALRPARALAVADDGPAPI
jgi:hypothetical protein